MSAQYYVEFAPVAIINQDFLLYKDPKGVVILAKWDEAKLGQAPTKSDLVAAKAVFEQKQAEKQIQKVKLEAIKEKLKTKTATLNEIQTILVPNVKTDHLTSGLIL